MVLSPPHPYFSLPRPFEAPLETRPSRYYPYGTDAAGQYLMHHGVDFANPLGTPVRAIAAGVVLYSGPDSEAAWGPTTDFYGRLVVVQHDEPLRSSLVYSLYGHLDEVSVAAGDKVAAGAIIGAVGAEGVALGPHLHLELRVGGLTYYDTANPELFLVPLPGHGSIVGRVVDRRGRPLAEVPVELHRAGPEGASQWLARTTTYPAVPVTSDPLWRENMLFGDLRPGEYVVTASVDGRVLRSSVTVVDGAASRTELWLTP